MLANYHTHTPRCGHAIGSERQYIERAIEEGFKVLGFSDHTQGALAASIAVGMEAVIFEKHFTLSHDLKGPDHWFSAEPNELKNWATL